MGPPPYPYSNFQARLETHTKMSPREMKCHTEPHISNGAFDIAKGVLQPHSQLRKQGPTSPHCYHPGLVQTTKRSRTKSWEANRAYHYTKLHNKRCQSLFEDNKTTKNSTSCKFRHPKDGKGGHLQGRQEHSHP